MALPTLNVTPGTGATINTLPPGGQAAPASALPTTLDTTVETAVGTSGSQAVTVQGATSGVPVPVTMSGAATAAKQPALGTAGAPSADVITVQGNSAGKQVPVAETFIIATASFTRPANTTAYASTNLVANSTVAGSVVPLSFAMARDNNINGAIIAAKVDVASTTAATWINATLRLRFYGAAPVPANGDGGAWLTPKANYFGSMDVVLIDQFSDGVVGFASPLTVPEIDFAPATGTQNIFCLVETLTALTPVASDVFTVTLFGK